MRFVFVTVVGIATLFIASVVVAQALPAGAAGPAMSVRQEIAQAGALTKRDPDAAREALGRAVAGLVQAGAAATARTKDPAE